MTKFAIALAVTGMWLGGCGSPASNDQDGPSGACPITGDCAADQEVMSCIQIESQCNGFDDTVMCGCQGRIDVKGGCLAADVALSQCINRGPCASTCAHAARDACFDAFCNSHPTDADCQCIHGAPPHP